MDSNSRLQAVLDVGIALSEEKNRNRLYNIIITKSMELTSCDAGTLYIYDNDALYFKIMKTKSMNVDRGGDGEVIDLPPVPMKEGNICAYAAIHKKALNIEDVYADNNDFDFSGPKNYDKMTGYHTQSMIAVPLVGSDEKVVGVLQLINAMNDKGEVIPFDESLEMMVQALASQTAVAVLNAKYEEELKEQMWSFTEAMAAAIDERTPYNASHTRHVAEYSGMIADYINELHLKGEEEEYFSNNRREQLVMGALLHDIGKLVTPLEVMNKATRLGGKESVIDSRFENYRLRSRILYLEKKLAPDEYTETLARIDEAKETVDKVNSAGFVDEELRATLEKILEYRFDDDGEMRPFFTDDEKECLRIVKGTLTEGERKIMEGHVEITKRILDKVHFNSYFEQSPRWAAEHHECLNGRGYPNHLVAEQLETDARIIAVADICDALLATDRPYKKPLPKEKAFDIMRNMAKDGNIDGKLVEYLYACIG